MNPSVELVVVGDELLSGRTTDTNSTLLGTRLAAIGLPVARRQTVGDDEAAIAEAVQLAARRSRLVLVLGGLGPTSDDRTLDAVARAFGRELRLDRPTLRRIEARYRSLGVRMPALAGRQARVITGARLFANPVGMVPGSVFSVGDATVVLLPGVPMELDALYERIEPSLRRQFPASPQHTNRIRTFGRSEAGVAGAVERVLHSSPGVTVAYYPSTEGVDVVLRAPNRPAVRRAARVAAERLGTVVYEVGDRSLAEVVGALLRRRGFALATAESCTGGMIAARLTVVPGISESFVGGVVAYSDTAKTALLGVPVALLARHGAVSRAVVRAMALGACRRFGCDVGIAVSGVAGPGGGTGSKPVGLVYVAVAKKGRVRTARFLFGRPRRAVRERATTAALNLCRLVLQERRVR